MDGSLINHHRMLVIDDDAEMGKLIQSSGQQAGWDCSACTDPIHALATLDERVSLIVLDLVMPGMDGIEVIRKLAEINWRGYLILASVFDKKILYSAVQLAEDRGLEVIGILEKPFELSSLHVLLAKAPAGFRAPQAPVMQFGNLNLADAIANRHVTLHYQPLVSMMTGEWTGIEALVRWNHPDFGLLFPRHFIRMAESDSALSGCLTKFVVQQALTEFQSGAFGETFNGNIGINLSPIGLIDCRFPDRLQQWIDKFDCANIKLIFEVTETSVSTHPATAHDILARLRLKNHDLSIDDFGTGHANFANLRRLPLNELKIDMSFVHSAFTDPTSRIIVEKSITLGHELGLRIVAEGVETQEQWQWLRDIGCDVAQGYFIAKPMPAAELATWASNWRAPMTSRG